MAAQGHVVAEQQLAVPLHWFGGGPMQAGDDESPGAAAAEGPQGPLQVEDGAGHIVVTGNDGLLVEVREGRGGG